MCSLSASPLPTPSANRPSCRTALVAAAWAMIAGWIRVVGQVTAVVTGSRQTWLSAPIVDQTKGLWPWASIQGWKWSEIHSAANPASCARRAWSRSSAGPNSSEERKYPIRMPSLLPRSRATIRAVDWQNRAHAHRSADPRLHQPRRPRAPRGRPRPGRPERRRAGLPLARRDGPLLPDRTPRAARARDAGGIHDAGLPGGTDHPGRAADRDDRRGLPAPGAARQDRDDPGRAVRRPGLAGHRRGVERGGVARAGRTLPAGRHPVRAAGGGAAGLPADGARRRDAVPGPALPPGTPAELAAAAAPAVPADHGRWRRGEEDPAAGRQVRRRLQPVRHPGRRAQAGGPARALRAGGPGLRRDPQDRLLRAGRRRQGRAGGRGPGGPAPAGRPRPRGKHLLGARRLRHPIVGELRAGVYFRGRLMLVTNSRAAITVISRQ